LRIIKINATNSTNSFLKELAQSSSLDELTVAVTNKQTSGRGQMNNSWVSEPYKNLTFSLFTPLKKIKIEHQAYLNFAVSLAIYDTLLEYDVPKLYIKWPNDIMSDNKKICGILIENTFFDFRIKNTIVGIGLNVNQEKFDESLINASSLKIILKKNIDLEVLMNKIIDNINIKISCVELGNFNLIHNQYHEVLFRKGIPTTFLNQKTNQLFMGMIHGVTSSGDIQIQLEDNTIREFRLKEISFAKV